VRNIDPAEKAAESVGFVATTGISPGSRFARNETPLGAFIFPRNQGLSPGEGVGSRLGSDALSMMLTVFTPLR
jgi:hypothetical protein